jgi:hypothetical protein
MSDNYCTVAKYAAIVPAQNDLERTNERCLREGSGPFGDLITRPSAVAWKWEKITNCIRRSKHTTRQVPSIQGCDRE